MQIDYLKVFERLKDKDILYGGNNNFAIKREIEPFINHDNENEDLSYKYLLVQYEFYIFHAMHCVDLIKDGVSEQDIVAEGYSLLEIDTAKKLIDQYGDGFEKKKYLYVANMKMGLVAQTICLIIEGKPLNSIPIEIIESAKRRIKHADIEVKTECGFRS